MKNNPKLIAFAQSLGLVAYVFLLASIVQNAQNWFGPKDPSPMFGIMVFLLTFVISALISASLILGYPIFLFIKGKKKTAIKMVLQSIGWLIVFLLLVLLVGFVR